MLIAVTGASGFVGSRVVRDLLAEGAATRALSRRIVAGIPPSAFRHAPELGPQADWRAALEGVDVVIHAAARVHVMNDRIPDAADLYRTTNVEGTIALARQAANAGVRRFVFVSSIKVNGEETAPGRPFTPASSPAPTDHYGKSKAEAERQLFALGAETGMDIVVVRPVLVYGPGVRANFAALVAAVGRNLPLPFGLARNRRSLLFVGNLSSLLRHAARHDAAPGHIFLASDGEDLSVRDLIALIARAFGRKPRLIPVPTSIMSLAATIAGKRAVARRMLGNLQVDASACRDVMQWQPVFSPEQGISETVAAYLRSDRTMS